MRILVFGDSITQGFWDKEGGWTARLIKAYTQETLKDLDGRDWVEIYNLGVSGDTTLGVINRLKPEVQARQLYSEPEVLVFAVGTNDALLQDGKEFSTPSKYAEQLEELLTIASSITRKILFVGLYGVDDQLSNPWKYSSSGKSYTNERIWLFEQILRVFCHKNNVPLVKTYEQIHNKPEMFADGIHPSTEAHELIANLVQLELDKIIV